MSTYLQLCQKYQKVTGVTGAALISVANQTGMNEKITIWIADADEYIQSLYQDWNFLKENVIITLSSGQDAYTPAGMGITDLNNWDRKNFVINPGLANYSYVKEMDYRKWLKSAARLGVKTNSKPNQVVFKPDNSLVFVDVPDATYTVWAEYFRKPTRLSDNADTSDIPSQFENLILYRAKMFHGEYYEDISLYNSGMKDYDLEFTKLFGSQMDNQNIQTLGAADVEDAVVVTI